MLNMVLYIFFQFAVFCFSHIIISSISHNLLKNFNAFSYSHLLDLHVHVSSVRLLLKSAWKILASGVFVYHGALFARFLLLSIRFWSCLLPYMLCYKSNCSIWFVSLWNGKKYLPTIAHALEPICLCYL